MSKGEIITGQLKWFNLVKGYGFLTAEGYGDILIHAKVLKERYDVWATPKNGLRMTVEAVQTKKGWLATRIINLEIAA